MDNADGSCQDESVYESLIARIAKLNHYVSAVRKEPRIVQHRANELVNLLVPVHFPYRDETMVLERARDGRDSGLGNGLRGFGTLRPGRSDRYR